MKVCILGFNADTYGTSRLVRALTERNHTPLVLSPLDCSVLLQDGKQLLLSDGTALPHVDVVLPRCVTYFHQGRPIARTVEAAAALAMVHNGACSINHPANKLVANDKILSLIQLGAHGIPIPPTMFTASALQTVAVSETFDLPYVLKLIEGAWGAGVMKVDSASSFTSVTEALFSIGEPLIAQPYLHSSNSRHLRVLVLGKSVLAGYETNPKNGDFRGNIAAGASANQIALTKPICDVALASAHALSLEFAGIDIIDMNGDLFVLEVNPAPGFQFADTLPGVSVADSLVLFLESCCAPTAT